MGEVKINSWLYGMGSGDIGLTISKIFEAHHKAGHPKKFKIFIGNDASVDFEFLIGRIDGSDCVFVNLENGEEIKIKCKEIGHG